jgi:excisionase family DNA binding protein
MSEYIKVDTAADLAGLTVQTIYKAIRKGVLKYKTIARVRYTTKPWLNDYLSSRFDRQRVCFQGKRCFDYLAGEWSVKMAATYLQTTIQSIHYMIRNGHIKSYRKGSYHVIPRESVDQMMATRGYIRYERKTKKSA